MLFGNEDEMQELSRKIARVFYQKGTTEDINNFIETEYVPRHLIKDVKKFLVFFELEHYTVVLSYARLLLRERYKL